MLTILIESGHERNRNAGDEAYFSSMVQLFRKHLGPVRILTFSDRPDRDHARYGVETVYCGGTLQRTLLSSLEIISAIRACDIYVWGSGQILRDDTGIKSPLYRLSRPLVAKVMGKCVVAYAVGVGPVEMRATRLLAKWILNAFDLITVRDRKSLDIVKRLGVVNPEVFLTVDPAFGLRAGSSNKVENALMQMSLPENMLVVGVAPFGPAFRGVRSLLPAKYQVRLNMWRPGGKGKYEEHVRRMASICDRIVEKYNTALLFIAQDASWQGCDDQISNDIMSHMSHPENAILINADDYRPEVLIGIMRRMFFMVGGRMHSLILACRAGVPVLGICFEDKIRQLATIIRQNEYFVDADEVEDSAKMHSIIDKIWEKRSRIGNEIVDAVGKLEVEVEKNVQRLRRLAAALKTGQRAE